MVLGIDLEKAFNRLDHAECLHQLRSLGASDTSLALVRSFLTQRSMRVKEDGVFSSLRQLKGGSPLGSILGCLLYCVVAQQLGKDLMPLQTNARSAATTPPESKVNHVPCKNRPVESPDGFNLVQQLAPRGLRLDESTSTEGSFHTADEITPPRPGTPDRGVLPDLEDEDNLDSFRYVDDTTLVKTVDRERVARHVSANNLTE